MQYHNARPTLPGFKERFGDIAMSSRHTQRTSIVDMPRLPRSQEYYSNAPAPAMVHRTPQPSTSSDYLSKQSPASSYSGRPHTALPFGTSSSDPPCRPKSKRGNKQARLWSEELAVSAAKRPSISASDELSLGTSDQDCSKKRKEQNRRKIQGRGFKNLENVLTNEHGVDFKGYNSLNSHNSDDGKRFKHSKETILNVSADKLHACAAERREMQQKIDQMSSNALKKDEVYRQEKKMGCKIMRLREDVYKLLEHAPDDKEVLRILLRLNELRAMWSETPEERQKGPNRLHHLQESVTELEQRVQQLTRSFGAD